MKSCKAGFVQSLEHGLIYCSAVTACLSGRVAVEQNEICLFLQVWEMLAGHSCLEGASHKRCTWSSGPFMVMWSSALASFQNHCRWQSDWSLEQPPLDCLMSAVASSWTYGVALVCGMLRLLWKLAVHWFLIFRAFLVLCSPDPWLGP